MNEFSWWLLIVGLVVGAGLVWLILADSNRRDDEVEERELRGEAAWIAAVLAEHGRRVELDLVEQVLHLHRDYLSQPPPDDPDGGTVDAAQAAVVDPAQAAAVDRPQAGGLDPAHANGARARDREDPLGTTRAPGAGPSGEGGTERGEREAPPRPRLTAHQDDGREADR